MQLDQGQTNHCVGFGWAQWGNTNPILDSYQDSDGHAIYYECKQIDGEPGQEDGSNVRSGAKAMQNRNKLNAYAFAETVDEIISWVRTNGPVVVGTTWTNDMFSPDKNGLVVPTGATAGGHCYLCVGDIASEQSGLFQNSWGTSWGLNGYFKIKWSDFDTLFKDQGEACAAVEI